MACRVSLLRTSLFTGLNIKTFLGNDYNCTCHLQSSLFRRFLEIPLVGQT